MTESMKLDTRAMATFVARGFLRFDGIVPETLNNQFLRDAVNSTPSHKYQSTYNKANYAADSMSEDGIPEVPAGTNINNAYPKDSTLGSIVNLPKVRGMIESLVGSQSRLDHHFLHMTFPEEYYEATNRPPRSQNTHQDSTIDPRTAFDIQLFYFPHEVTPDMGGTPFIPGTHLRIVSEAAIGRYQNMLGQQHVVCPAGTIIAMHHGIWHGGGYNRSDQPRYMFKIRLAPSSRQYRLWDTSDLQVKDHKQRPIFFKKNKSNPEDVSSILVKPEPWFEQDTGRIEYINRIHLWRYLIGDEAFDADYWVTRIENEY